MNVGTRGLIGIVLLVTGLTPAGVWGQQRPAARGKQAPPPKPAASAPKTERVVPFEPGETLTYDISWSTYLTAGTATVTVKEKKPSFGSQAYYIVAEGRPTPLLSKLYRLYYKLDTLLDAYTLLPQRGSVYSEEGSRRKLKVTRFDQAARKAHFEIQTATLVKAELETPAYVQDALSAIYVLRAVPLQTGGKMTIPVCDSGETYRVQLAIGQKEPVKAGIGSVTAWRITPTIHDQRGQVQGQKLTIWLTDDARRLPVKMMAELPVGSFNLTLRELHEGTSTSN